jgi:hypothetical protein
MDVESEDKKSMETKRVTWWIMGGIAALGLIGLSASINSTLSRISGLESGANVRAERLRTLEVQFIESDKYSIGRDGDLKLRLARIEEKVDSLDRKVSKLP